MFDRTKGLTYKCIMSNNKIKFDTLWSLRNSFTRIAAPCIGETRDFDFILSVSSDDCNRYMLSPNVLLFAKQKAFEKTVRDVFETMGVEPRDISFSYIYHISDNHFKSMTGTLKLNLDRYDEEHLENLAKEAQHITSEEYKPCEVCNFQDKILKAEL